LGNEQLLILSRIEAYNMTEVNYIDDILDIYGMQGDAIIWELYLQNNLVKYCNLTKGQFYDIYYSLFLNDIENFKTLNLEIDDTEECCEIIYSELLDQAKAKYPIADFINEIDKKEWISIIKDSKEINEQPINLTIYNFYKEKYIKDNGRQTHTG